jgi:adenylate cyclase class 2
MNHKNIETEVKILVSDLQAVADKLRKLNASLTAERVFERNIRYDDDAGTLTRGGYVLRLRQDTRARLTYKAPGDAAQGILSRKELEVTVSDFETTDLLLKALGYHPSWEYEKYRTTYELNDCEIVLDEMPYGNFVEVEGEQANIERVLSMLDLAGEPRVAASYSDLFFRVKERMKLDFRDLTFENFKSVNVPKEMISPGKVS